MRSSYSASVVLTNEDGLWEPENFLWQPFQVKLDASVLESQGIVESCFNGVISWVFGLVVNFNEKDELSNDEVQLSINSYASRLAKKPVITGPLANAKDALELIAHEMGGLSPALTAFAPTTKTVCGPANGTNMMQEMMKIAQAACQDLFINRNGILVTQDWKDHNSAVDVVLPPEAVLSANRKRDIQSGPTRYQVRGCWEWKDKLGGKKEQQSQGGQSNPKNTKKKGKKAKMKHCIGNALPRKVIAILLKEINDDRVNALDVVITGAGEYAGPADYTEELMYGNSGETGVRMTNGDPNDDSAHYQKGDYEVTVSAKALDNPQDPELANAHNLGEKHQAAHGKEDVEQIKAVMRQMGAGVGRGAGHAGGGPGGQGGGGKGGGSPSASAMEKVEYQLAVIVNDPDLQAEMGILPEEIENTYIPDREIAYNVAVRAFQEWKMARKAWDVESAYVTCLDVGQKITFTTPEGDVITGLLTDIKVNYSPGPKAKMSLIVHSMEDIGSTTFTSPTNLLRDPVPKSTESVPWTIPLGSRANPGDGLTLLGSTEATQELSLTIGDTYTIEIENVYLNGDVNLEIRDSGVHASGISPLTFTPDEVSNTVALMPVFDITAQLTEIKLTKTKVG